MTDRQSPRFQRTVEDFVCERCGTANTGDGYTNHCRACLHSKHVDVQPGDRASACGGLMRPVDVFRSDGRWKLVHECERCGCRRANRVRDEETDAVIGTMRRLAEGRDRAGGGPVGLDKP